MGQVDSPLGPWALLWVEPWEEALLLGSHKASSNLWGRWVKPPLKSLCFCSRWSWPCLGTSRRSWLQLWWMLSRGTSQVGGWVEVESIKPFCRPGCPHPDGNGRQRHPGGAAHLRCHLPQVAFQIPLSSTISFILFRGQGLQVKGAWRNRTWFLCAKSPPLVLTDCQMLIRNISRCQHVPILTKLQIIHLKAKVSLTFRFQIFSLICKWLSENLFPQSPGYLVWKEVQTRTYTLYVPVNG